MNPKDKHADWLLKPTANQLADLIGMCGDGGYNQDAATMLRQQQAEIEALKALLVKEQDESFDRTASHMAGEYVSYKAELTDEEIRTIQDMCHLKNAGYNTFIMRFARAILKRAQNK